MSTIRKRQHVAEMLFQELSILIANELADPASVLSSLSVDVSPDLRSVKIFVKHDDEELASSRMLEGLKRRYAQIANRCNLRVVLNCSSTMTTQRKKPSALLRQIAEKGANPLLKSKNPVDGATGDAHSATGGCRDCTKARVRAAYDGALKVRMRSPCS